MSNIYKNKPDRVGWGINEDSSENIVTDGTSGEPNISEPSDAIKLSGFLFRSYAPRQWFNWVFAKFSQWFDWTTAAIDQIQISNNLAVNGKFSSLFGDYDLADQPTDLTLTFNTGVAASYMERQLRASCWSVQFPTAALDGLTVSSICENDTLRVYTQGIDINEGDIYLVTRLDAEFSASLPTELLYENEVHFTVSVVVENNSSAGVKVYPYISALTSYSPLVEATPDTTSPTLVGVGSVARITTRYKILNLDTTFLRSITSGGVQLSGPVASGGYPIDVTLSNYEIVATPGEVTDISPSLLSNLTTKYLGHDCDNQKYLENKQHFTNLALTSLPGQVNDSISIEIGIVFDHEMLAIPDVTVALGTFDLQKWQVADYSTDMRVYQPGADHGLTTSDGAHVMTDTGVKVYAEDITTTGFTARITIYGESAVGVVTDLEIYDCHFGAGVVQFIERGFLTWTAKA